MRRVGRQGQGAGGGVDGLLWSRWYDSGVEVRRSLLACNGWGNRGRGVLGGRVWARSAVRQCQQTRDGWAVKSEGEGQGRQLWKASAPFNFGWHAKGGRDGVRTQGFTRMPEGVTLCMRAFIE